MEQVYQDLILSICLKKSPLVLRFCTFGPSSILNLFKMSSNKIIPIVKLIFISILNDLNI